MLRTTLLLTAGMTLLLSPLAVAQTNSSSSYGSATSAAVQTASSHAAWTSILQNYVSAPDGQGLTHFDYARLSSNAADKAKLASYIQSLSATNPGTLSQNEAIAFYSNLYNAVTIDLIVQNYPVGSIRKAKTYNGEKVSGIAGPWKKVKVSVNGQTMSLNDVEHEVLRKQFPSPYVHYMVNCASVGCPNLLDTAWEANTLDAARKKAATDYINSPRGVKITPKGLVVSSIFKWFKEDFGGSKANVLKHIRQHANPQLAAAIDSGATITGYDYDWSLNN